MNLTFCMKINKNPRLKSKGNLKFNHSLNQQCLLNYSKGYKTLKKSIDLQYIYIKICSLLSILISSIIVSKIFILLLFIILVYTIYKRS